MQIHTANQVAKYPAGAFSLRSPASARMDAGTTIAFGKDEELFAEGDEAEYFYQVVSGVIRSYKMLSDGRRQIDAFHLPGDIFGLEAGAEHRFYAEAVGEASVVAFKRSSLSSLIHNDPAFRERVMSATLSSLERAQNHMLLLGRKTADEKIASFLLDMAQRISRGGASFELPMQRSDIADHLGLTIETVSRILSRFTRSGLIKLVPASRSIGLCNKAALLEMNA